ncbi:aspartate aminotransferase family protein [Cryomorpha ignava]|uniref:Aspartate aminotransferase family protein n=1 Tax=Cryomorpha ignava TaxID=101383 RepID=A0A7K3WLI0_9FLAO|nr:aspartate aminotransferase family protein [Cryomorpha ignava]NEN22334.1 aspartate aminotransferase family protein [Cryomorpha ignava]
MIAETRKSVELLERRKKVVANGVGVFNTATVQHARGAIITDVDGRELIDFAGGIGVVNAGHCPESVVKAIQEQAAKYLHTSFNVVSYEPYVQLCEKLIEILPHGGETKAMLVSTGAEAVENAVKIARQATGRQAVIGFSEAYHGRTMMAMTLTSKIGYKIGCGPFAPEVYRLRFPNFYLYGKGMDYEAFIDQELDHLEKSTHNLVDPSIVAAIIIEAVQGEGGFNPVPKRYLEGLRAHCDKYEIMLIIDEVQSGFCRTGYWASWQHYGVTPDLSTYAKSMGSGMPIAAVVGRTAVMDAAASGSIGGTYIGNPVCCAAALATIKLMEELDLNSRANYIADQINQRLHNLKKQYSSIGDVRGLGAMIGIEFVKHNDPEQPDSDLCNEIVRHCAHNDLIIISAGMEKNIIRILSPLVITDEQLNRGLVILETAITESIKKSI